MDKSTKAFVFITFFLIIIGSALLSFGLKQAPSTREPIASPSGVLVTRVIDGDTIEIEGGAKVRYLGVDTPETKDPRKPVQCFGKEAISKNKELVEGKRIVLEKDITDRDKYDRLLRFVFLDLGSGTKLFVNDFLIREGYGQVLTIPPDVKYSEQFLEAQREARGEKKGLWGRCL